MEWQKDIDTTTKHKKKPPKHYVSKKVRADGGHMDDDDDKQKPQLILSSDGMVDVNPYAEKPDIDEDVAKMENIVVDHDERPKGETASQKAARSGTNEIAGMWNRLSDPLAPVPKHKKAKKVPKVNQAPLRRLGAAARNKIAPDGLFSSEKKKVLPAGSDGNEWWREDSGMPPRKARGGKAKTGFGRDDKQAKDLPRPKTAPGHTSVDERPKTSGGRSKSPGKGKHHDKGGARPKTPNSLPDKHSSPPKSPKSKGSRKKVDARPATAPNPTR